MKACVSVYSFYSAYRRGEIAYMDIPAKAREIGFKAVEFIDLPTPEGMDIMEFAYKIAERCKECDIKPVQYSPHADFWLGSDKDPWAEAERIKKLVDVATVLGVSGLRHDHAWRFEDPYRMNWTDILKVIVDPIRSVTEYAQTKGIKTMSENHGHLFQEGERMEALIRGVDHKNYGCLVDIGNSICVDYDPLKNVDMLAPYCMHVHAKDFFVRPGDMTDPGAGWAKTRLGNYRRATIFGHGCLHMPQTFAILKSYNYDGYVSLEFEGIEDNFMAVQIGYTNLMKYMDAEIETRDDDVFKKVQQAEK